MNPGLDAAIANRALYLAMEWGEDWLKPIQNRLGRAYPKLADAELDTYDRAAREAMARGHGLVGDLVEQLGPDSPILYSRWCSEFLAYAPWAAQENLRRLFSQGMYYAMK